MGIADRIWDALAQVIKMVDTLSVMGSLCCN